MGSNSINEICSFHTFGYNNCDFYLTDPNPGAVTHVPVGISS